MNKTLLIRALVVCLLPLFTAIFFALNPAEAGSSTFLIYGIILACECAFLFKWIVFAIIAHHLRGEHTLKLQTAWLFIPLILLAVYIAYYFGAFA
ncbi:MAG: hypothetical protein Q4E16_04045 [Neisseria sp.]|nr:hypothetical protein [Neisseria sp.]